ncbi:MAG: M24 family metallopeptidase [bacterium]
MINHKVIIDKLRLFMKSKNLDFFIVNSTDEYLNEYVDLSENSRYILTGFSGSTGNALVTRENIFLFVDGRYHLQADNETDKNLITVVKLGINTSFQAALSEKITELSQPNQKIGFVSSKISYFCFKELSKTFSDKNFECCEFEYDPILNECRSTPYTHPVRHISTEYTGLTAEEKLNLTIKELDNADILVLTKLDEIAYITNLRGNEIPYNSTFKAKAIINKNQNKCLIFTDLEKITKDIQAKLGKIFEFRQENTFIDYLNKNLSLDLPVNIDFNPYSTSLYIYRQLENTKNNLVEFTTNPISEMKSVKNNAELNHIQLCFKKTDIVINRAISWLNQNLEKKAKISEKDFADKVKILFLEEGACDLSFETIAASGKNTAFIHYTNPDPQKYIEMGELVLLDCGAYFEGGYATDVTRTFLAGGTKASPDPKAKQIYTKVLKALLYGLNMEIDENTTGFDIDKAVREILTKDIDESFKFSHGTGHGIGILVHEAPPRLGASDICKTKLKPGMCFTIEPGLYNDDWGGVRLENTVTIVKDNSKMKIKSLTNCKFDENLINSGNC